MVRKDNPTYFLDQDAQLTYRHGKARVRDMYSTI